MLSNRANEAREASRKKGKPFCKVCFDANKPESQYTSHFVRKTKDLNSEILCPIILATECRYCHKIGHTISKCSVRQQNNYRRMDNKSFAQAPKLAPAPAPVRGNNRYSVFEVDDEVEIDNAVDKETFCVKVNDTEFPSIGGKSSYVAVQETPNISYANAFGSKPVPFVQCNDVEKTHEKKYENFSSTYNIAQYQEE